MSDLNSQCDLCGSAEALALVAIAPRDDEITLCATCAAGAGGEIDDAPHWRCLSDAIWSQNAAVQVTAYRLLKALEGQTWARDILDIAYLEPEVQEWADAVSLVPDPDAVVHKDTNGAVLSAGDTVTLIKDLNVKGGGFTAKRGTPVRNISLVHDNAGQIEGRVNGQQIVILTEFVKKNA